MTVNHPTPDEVCGRTVYWWDGEYEGECELKKGHLEPFHYDGSSYFDDDNSNRDLEQDNLKKLLSTNRIKTLEEVLEAGPKDHDLAKSHSFQKDQAVNQNNDQWRSVLKALMGEES